MNLTLMYKKRLKAGKKNRFGKVTVHRVIKMAPRWHQWRRGGLKINKILNVSPEARDNFPNDGEEGLWRDGRLVTAVQADQHLAQLFGHQTVTLVVPQVAECWPPPAVFGLQCRQLLDVTAKFLNVAVGKRVQTKYINILNKSRN
jgi:hypothetical protein